VTKLLSCGEVATLGKDVLGGISITPRKAISYQLNVLRKVFYTAIPSQGSLKYKRNAWCCDRITLAGRIPMDR
jgi:hypothetical protein